MPDIDSDIPQNRFYSAITKEEFLRTARLTLFLDDFFQKVKNY